MHQVVHPLTICRHRRSVAFWLMLTRWIKPDIKHCVRFSVGYVQKGRNNFNRTSWLTNLTSQWRFCIVFFFITRESVSIHFDPTKIPEHWAPMNTQLTHFVDFVPIGEGEEVWSIISQEFHLTMPKTSYILKGIYRVQNLNLWNSYQK